MPVRAAGRILFMDEGFSGVARTWSDGRPEIQQKKVSKIVYEMNPALRGATPLYRNPAAP